MKLLFTPKPIVTTLLMSAMAFNVQSQTTLTWGRQIGTDKEEYAMNHVDDGNGNIYICGKTFGNMEGVNQGKNDGYITKIDSLGNTKWTKQFGSAGDDDEQWSAIDQQGNIYITGSTTGDLNGKNAGKEDIFLVKYNADGQLLWTKQLGTDSTDIGKGVYADNKGFVYITGLTMGKLGESSFGKMDGFIIKLDGNGKQLFTTQFGTPGDDSSISITGDNLSTIYVCGNTWGDLGGKSKGFIDVFTGQFTDEGTLIKYNQFGSDGFDITMNLKVDSEKNLYVVGSTTGNIGCQQIGEGDCFLTKISEKGVVLWTSQFGTPKHDGIRGITFVENSPGKILVSGLLSLPPAQAFVRMYNTDGSFGWEKKMIEEGKPGDASGKDVSVDKHGNIYHIGLTGIGLFGEHIGSNDVYVVKLKMDM